MKMTMGNTKPVQPTPDKVVRKPGRKNGFSLLELLVVVAIIAIIAAVALPKLLSARTAAVETAGAASTRSVMTGIAAYNAKWNVYPATLGALGGTCNATTPATAAASCLMDDTMATTGLTGQYQMTYAINGGDFTLNADPIATSAAQRHFYADGNNAIRYADGAAASATSSVLGQ